MAASALLAIVLQNPVALRAAPRDSAAQQATLWAGDSLEVRGTRADYLMVYDHRRERAGYVRLNQVREVGLEAADAPALLTVLRFLRDTPGSEALGISYGAAYLRAAAPGTALAEPLEAIGSMADRLAQRASTATAGGASTTAAAHLEVVAQYGIAMKSFERNGSVQVCYEGEMLRRALAQPETPPDAAARAALGLTRHECVDPDLAPGAREALDRWRADILDRVPVAKVSEPLASRVRLRRAGVYAALAFEQSRRNESPADAGTRAVREFALANRAELADDDLAAYQDAAVRVGASRWAATTTAHPVGPLTVHTVPRAPGETCVQLYPAHHAQGEPLVSRCTYGTVWTASATANARGSALAIAVQPLEGWRELWLFRKRADGWQVDVLPPATSDPDRGYLEFAGWDPGGQQVLLARDVYAGPLVRRRFEVMNLETLTVAHQAPTPDVLGPFVRWKDPTWVRDSVVNR